MGTSAMARAVRGSVVVEQQARPSLLMYPVSMVRRGWERLGARRFAWLAAFSGILLTLPALTIGFAQDDHFLALVFAQHPLASDLNMGILDNFVFSDGDPATNQLRFEMGVLPWWAVPDWQVSFWRPIPSLMHWLEYKVFGHWPLPMHVISLLFYGGLCFAAAVLFRQLHLGAWSAGLAALLFTFDSVHGVPAGWISDRNALLSALFGVLTLIAHHRWRTAEDGGRAWAAGAIASLALGLFCGEAALSTGAYLFAYQACIDPATRLGAGSPPLRQLSRGIATLLPYLGVVIVWRAIYLYMDYGVHGSWMYVDPLSEPWIFLQNVFWYTPIFLLGAYALPDGVAWNFVPASWALTWSVLAWAFLITMIAVLWPLLRRSAVARFWLLGSLLSAVPCSATIPGDRIITFPALGAMGLAALFLADRCDALRASPAPRRSLAGALAGLFIVCHLLASPFALLAASQSIRTMHDFFARASNSLPDDGTIAQQNIIALRTPLDMLGASMPLFRIPEDKPLPAQWRYLYSGVWSLDIERPDARTLVLRPDNGFLPHGLGQVFRDTRAHPMAQGYTKSLDGMTAEVLEVNDQGRPTEVRFTFDSDLDAAAMRFVQWERGDYVPVELPEPGGRMTLPGTDFYDILAVALKWDTP